MENNQEIKLLDSLLPPEMARAAEEVGVAKAGMGIPKTTMLAILAGAFIAFGAIFSTLVSAGSTMSYGVTKLLSGLAFSLGLILVVVGGAELFTGNNLLTMAWASKKVSTWQILRNWLVVYLGNIIGGAGFVGIAYWLIDSSKWSNNN